MEQLPLFAPSEAPAPVAPAPLTPDIASTASRLERLDPTGTSVYLGTSSWAFPGWKDIVYDRAASKTVLSRKGLAAYSAHPLLRAVCLDRTYYAPLPASELRSYAEQVPEAFRFVVKAHELLTLARLRDPARTPNENYLNPSYAIQEVVGPCLEGLGSRLGVLLLQFPPQNAATLGGPARFANELHRFLTELPKTVLYAIELRNSELFTAPYLDALSGAGACHCFNVHPTMPDIAEQAEAADVSRFPALVIRWMLRRDRGYEDAREAFYPFDRLAEEDSGARAAIAHLCRGASSRRPAFVVINNKAEGSAPLSAIRLAQEITSG